MKLLIAATALSVSAAAGAADPPLAISVADPAVKWAPCPALFPAGCELTILRGDPAKPGADAVLRVPGGYVFPAHSHSSAERMVLIGGKLAVHYQGHRAATLNAGDYAFGPAGLPHVATCVSTEPCVLFIAFEKPVDAMLFDGKIE